MCHRRRKIGDGFSAVSALVSLLFIGLFLMSAFNGLVGVNGYLRDEQRWVVNGTIDGVPVSHQISRVAEYTYQYTMKKDVNIRIKTEVSSRDNNSLKYPLIFEVRQQILSQSWRLPVPSLADPTLVYTQTERTLCTRSQQNLTVNSSILGLSLVTVTVSTLSPYILNYSIAVDYEDNMIGVGQPASVEVAPLSPKMFHFSFPSLKDFNSSFVDLVVKSDDPGCMTVSVQEPLCPLLDQDSNVRHEGYWHTMVSKAGMTLQRGRFPEGVFILLVMHDDDDLCISGDHHEVSPKLIPKIIASGRNGTNLTSILEATEMTWTLTSSSSNTTSSSRRSRNKIVEVILKKPITKKFYIVGCLSPVGLILLVFYFPSIFCAGGLTWIGDKLSCIVDLILWIGKWLAFIPYFIVSSFILKGFRYFMRKTKSCAIWIGKLFKGAEKTGEDDDDDEVEPKPEVNKVTKIDITEPLKKDDHQLSRKSSLYLYATFIVAVFYSVPAIQLVLMHHNTMHKTGRLDMCYYNFHCAVPFEVPWVGFTFTDFNHFFSNVGYILLGSLGLYLVRRKRKAQEKERRFREETWVWVNHGGDGDGANGSEENGIPSSTAGSGVTSEEAQKIGTNVVDGGQIRQPGLKGKSGAPTNITTPKTGRTTTAGTSNTGGGGRTGPSQGATGDNETIGVGRKTTTNATVGTSKIGGGNRSDPARLPGATNAKTSGVRSKMGNTTIGAGTNKTGGVNGTRTATTQAATKANGVGIGRNITTPPTTGTKAAPSKPRENGPDTESPPTKNTRQTGGVVKKAVVALEMKNLAADNDDDIPSSSDRTVPDGVSVKSDKSEDDKEFGIPPHFGIYKAQCLAIIVEGVLSMSYHICPNRSNFHHDTCFMYVSVILTALKLYHGRHSHSSASACLVFASIAGVIVVNVLGEVLEYRLFWWILFLVHLILCLRLAVHFFYDGEVKIGGLQDFFWKVMLTFTDDNDADPSKIPTDDHRYILIVLGTAFNVGFGIHGIVDMPHNFDSYLLALLGGNMLLYFVYYVGMKLVHGEKVSTQFWSLLLLSSPFWFGGVYFFSDKRTSWEFAPAKSREFNGECVLFDFYDSHDLWHFLSAAGLFLTLMALLIIDDDLKDTPRNKYKRF